MSLILYIPLFFSMYDSYLLWIGLLVNKTSNFFGALELDLVSCDFMCEFY